MKQNPQGDCVTPEPTEIVDEARACCARIATLGALLRAAGTPGDVDLNTINYSGDMIEREAARMRESIDSLNAWIVNRHCAQQEQPDT